MAAEIPSPCTSVCTIDPATGWCAGCLRTIDEIAAWGEHTRDFRLTEVDGDHWFLHRNRDLLRQTLSEMATS